MDCEIYTPKEVAKILKISENSVYTRIRAGEIPSCRFGRLIRVPKDRLARRIQGDDDGQGEHRDQGGSEDDDGKGEHRDQGGSE